VVEADMAALDRDGYVIWRTCSPPSSAADPRRRHPWLGHTGRNSFEGGRLSGFTASEQNAVCDPLVDHPRVLAVLDRLLMPNYLLSALQPSTSNR